MTKIAGRDATPVDTQNGETRLEQRFGDIGAEALIEECVSLSDRVASLARRLAEVERSAETILDLLEFPLPKHGALSAPLMKRVVVTAKMFRNPADGFHALESSADGTAFRWTGPQPEFRFMVYVDRRRSCRGELILIDSGRFDGLAEIACYVDRSWVKSELRRANGEKFVTVSVDIPALDVNRGTEILFVAPSVFVPRDDDPGSLDARLLGVQFVELRVDGSDAGLPQDEAADERRAQ
jgi:hypothetical protein